MQTVQTMSDRRLAERMLAIVTVFSRTDPPAPWSTYREAHPDLCAEFEALRDELRERMRRSDGWFLGVHYTHDGTAWVPSESQPQPEEFDVGGEA